MDAFEREAMEEAIGKQPGLYPVSFEVIDQWQVKNRAWNDGVAYAKQRVTQEMQDKLDIVTEALESLLEWTDYPEGQCPSGIRMTEAREGARQALSEVQKK